MGARVPVVRERTWLGHDEEESDEETGYEVADEGETRDDETDGRTANWGSELVFFCIYGASYVSLGPCMLRVNREEPEVLEIAGMRWKVSVYAFCNYRSTCLSIQRSDWVTIHNARNIYIRRRRVPLSEVYSSISENFHLAYTSGIEQSCVEVNASVWDS